MPVMRSICAKQQVADVLHEQLSVHLAQKCLHDFQKHNEVSVMSHFYRFHGHYRINALIGRTKAGGLLDKRCSTSAE